MKYIKTAKYEQQIHQAFEGGLSDGKKQSDFDEKELRQGIEVEKEHANDESIAARIAMDHLTEDPEYYDKLAKMEKGKYD